MGTLKSVCSSWFALISCDKYEHTQLRVPISTIFLLKIQQISQFRFLPLLEIRCGLIQGLLLMHRIRIQTKISFSCLKFYRVFCVCENNNKAREKKIMSDIFLKKFSSVLVRQGKKQGKTVHTQSKVTNIDYYIFIPIECTMLETNCQVYI